MSEKIQKILANAGVGSRRQVESWIEEGRITVNGEVATIGDRMTHHDQVCVDGREIKLLKNKSQNARVLIYHKPEGELCTRNDPEGRPTIFQSLPMIRNSRWVSVGRLDLNTSGLLLITNDGDLANKLMHPSSEIERQYAVRVHGNVTSGTLKKLKDGVQLEDGFAAFETIEDSGGSGSNHWYHVTVREGRNRLVRRLWESQGLDVSRLIRIRFGPLQLPTRLKRGRYMELSPEDISLLVDHINRGGN